MTKNVSAVSKIALNLVSFAAVKCVRNFGHKYIADSLLSWSPLHIKFVKLVNGSKRIRILYKTTEWFHFYETTTKFVLCITTTASDALNKLTFRCSLLNKLMFRCSVSVLTTAHICVDANKMAHIMNTRKTTTKNFVSRESSLGRHIFPTTLCNHRRRSSVNFRGEDIFARKICMKIIKMPEFCMIPARKIIEIPEFLRYLPEKVTKSRILRDFCPKNAKILHNNARKIFFLIFLRGGGARAPCTPSSTPMYAMLQQLSFDQY